MEIDADMYNFVHICETYLFLLARILLYICGENTVLFHGTGTLLT